MPTANPKLEVLTPQNCQLIFIDQQPQMAFGVQSIDRQVLKNNVVALAKRRSSKFRRRSPPSRVRASPVTPILNYSTCSRNRSCSSGLP
jgi:hypothetical protein